MSNQGQGTLTFTQHHSDIKNKNLLYPKITLPLNFVTRFCMLFAYSRGRYKVSVYRAIVPHCKMAKNHLE